MAKLAKMKVKPSEMFRSETDKYSSFDETVIQTIYSLLCLWIRLCMFTLLYVWIRFKVTIEQQWMKFIHF